MRLCWCVWRTFFRAIVVRAVGIRSIVALCSRDCRSCYCYWHSRQWSFARLVIRATGISCSLFARLSFALLAFVAMSGQRQNSIVSAVSSIAEVASKDYFRSLPTALLSFRTSRQSRGTFCQRSVERHHKHKIIIYNAPVRNDCQNE